MSFAGSTIGLTSLQKAILIVVVIVTGVGVVANSGVLYAPAADKTLSIVPVNSSVLSSPFNLYIDKIGSGDVYPPPGTYQLVNNSIEVNAVPSDGWVYDHWVIDGQNTSDLNPILIDSLSNHTITAVFEPIRYFLDVSVIGNGAVTATPDQLTYDSGTNVQLTAVTGEGWVFDGWSGDVSSSSNSITLRMNEDTNVTATFKQQPSTKFSLIVKTTGSGDGTVVLDPPGGIYPEGTVVTLTAKPMIGSSFGGWTDLTTNSSIVRITLTKNEDITAIFNENVYNLTIVINPENGGFVTFDHNGPYKLNETVTLTESPINGYKFMGWSEPKNSSDQVLTLTISSNEVITANFMEDLTSPTSSSSEHVTSSTPSNHTDPSDPAYKLTVHTSGQGSVSMNPDQDNYTSGSKVQLTATPSLGWVFTGWSGAVSGSSNTITITINDDEEVTATFTQSQYSLVVDVTPSSGGIVTRNNNGPYHLNDVVVLTESSNSGYTFSGWSGSGTGSGSTRTVTVTGNMAVTATFTQSQYSLTVNVSPTDGGTVTRNNNGPYHLNDVVVLTESSNSGYTFSGWSGGGTGSGSTRTVTVTGNMAVTATFTQSQYSLTVNVSPTDGGTVTRNNNGPYHLNDVVVLTESPSLGYTFSRWSGSGTGSRTTRTVTITGNMTVTVTYTQNTYSLTVTVNPSSGGTVTKSPSKTTYSYGDVVTLTESPSSGYTFSGWSGSGTGSGSTRTVTVTGNMAVTATFTQNQYILTISASGSGSTNPSTGSHTYIANSQIQVTATPASGWVFSHWYLDSVDVGSSNPITITINSAHSLQAVFTQNQYTISISASGQGSVSTSPNQATYIYGASVQITATPIEGWSFAGWSGDLTGSANPATITINGNKVFTATFIQNSDTYTLTVNMSGSGTGSVTVNPSWSQYPVGTIVTVTAAPDVGSSFSAWSGDITGSSNSISVTLDGDKTIIATFSQESSSSYTYTMMMSGSTIMVSNAAGSTVASGTDFGAVFTTLNGRLVSGDTVQLQNYVFPIKTATYLTKTHILLTGETGATIKGSGIGHGIFMRIEGSYNTVQNIIWDDNYSGGVVATVFLEGSYNTIQYCSLINCDRYGFATWTADHFTIQYNHIYKAQYGISGADNGASSLWSTDGLVQYNVIENCRDCGIKMKMWKNVLVTENTIDCGYKTWGAGQNGGQYGTSVQSDGCIGICYYHWDTPTQGVTASYNVIKDTTKTSQKGIAILVAPDQHLDWSGCPYPSSGMTILHNTCTVPFYGMILQGCGADVESNDCTVGGIRIDSGANNNVLVGNLGHVSNSGSGNQIS